MKKFLALILAVAMLSLAAGAFAVPDGVSHGTPPTPPEPIPSDETTSRVILMPVEVTETASVTIAVSTTIAAAAYVPTFQDTQLSGEDSITASLEDNQDFSDTEKETWAKAASTIAKAVEDKVKNDIATLFSAIASAISNLAPKENTALKEATSSTAADATTEQKLAVAESRLKSILGSSSKAKPLAPQSAVAPTETGAYKFPQQFGYNLWGTKVKGNRGARGKLNAVSASSVSVSASEEDEGIVFLNSAGEVTDHIPGSNEYNDNDEGDTELMPGYVNMIVVMEAGEEYEPIIYATEDDLAENSVTYDDTEEVEAEETTVTYEAKKVVVQVDKDGNIVEGSAVEVVALDATVADAIAKALSLPAGVTPKDAYDESEILEADELALAQEALLSAKITASDDNKYPMVDIAPFKGLTAGVYVISTDFASLPAGRSLSSDAEFEFYPDAFTATGKQPVVILDDDYNDVTAKPSGVLGKHGFIVFQINSASDGFEEVTVAAVDASAPILTVQMTAVESSSDGKKDDEKKDDEKKDDEKKTNLADDPGDAGGGCSAGFSALALAVLGAFIARKK